MVDISKFCNKALNYKDFLRNFELPNSEDFSKELRSSENQTQFLFHYDSLKYLQDILNYR